MLGLRLPKELDEEARNEEESLLRERLRLGFAILLAAVGVFTLADLQAPQGLAPLRSVLNLVSLGVIGGGFFALRLRLNRRSATALALVVFATIYITTALCYYGPATTAILCIAVTMGAAALLPWGPGSQLAAAALAAFATLLELYLEKGSLALTPGYLLLGVGVSLAASIYIAYVEGRQRAVLAERGLERTRAAGAFWQLFLAAPDAMVLVNRSGEIVMAGKQAERLFGYSRAELLGQPVELLVPERLQCRHAKQRATYHDSFVLQARCMGSGLDLWGRRKDGSEFPADISLSPVDTEHGHFVVAAVRDVTDRKRAERQLREDAQVSAALAWAGQEMVSNLDTPVLLERLCEVSANALECETSLTLLRRAEDNAWEVAATHGLLPKEQEVARAIAIPGGAMSALLSRFPRDAVVDASTLVDNGVAALWAKQFGVTPQVYIALWKGGEVVGVQMVGSRGQGEHLTQKRQRIATGIGRLASLALGNARLLAQASEASRLKSEFVATISHELRTPLNVIIGYADLMLAGEFGPLTAEQAGVLGQLLKSSGDLLELITTTLDLSRLERDQLPVDFTDTDLADLLHEIGEKARERWEKPGVSLHWSVPAALPRLYTDAGKLGAVIDNLVGNAIKFTEKGQVTVSASARDNGVELAVADTGQGIAPEALWVIFEPFRQADASATRTHGGVGLGLYVVRRLLEVLGGKITVESEAGCGSTFRVWLPCSRNGAQPDASRAACTEGPEESLAVG